MLQQHSGFSNRNVLAGLICSDGCITSYFSGGRAHVGVYFCQSNKAALQQIGQQYPGGHLKKLTPKAFANIDVGKYSKVRTASGKAGLFFGRAEKIASQLWQTGISSLLPGYGDLQCSTNTSQMRKSAPDLTGYMRIMHAPASAEGTTVPGLAVQGEWPHHLVYDGAAAKQVLEALDGHTVMKQTQVTAALEALSPNPPSSHRQQQLHATIRAANQAADDPAHLRAAAICDAWLAGAMMGDRSFLLAGPHSGYYYFQAQFTQVKSMRLLVALQRIYGGLINDCIDKRGQPQRVLRWRSAVGTANLLAAVMPHLPVKRQKVAVLLHEVCKVPIASIADPLQIDVSNPQRSPFSTFGKPLPWVPGNP